MACAASGKAPPILRLVAALYTAFLAFGTIRLIMDMRLRQLAVFLGGSVLAGIVAFSVLVPLVTS